MICNKCGKENNDSSKFCMWCGESLQTIGELNPNTDNTIIEEKTNNIEVNNNEPRKNKGKGLVIALIVVLLFIVGISGFLLGRYSVDKKDTSNNDGLEEEKVEGQEETEEQLIVSTYTSKCNSDGTKNFTVYGDVSKFSNIFEYIEKQEDLVITLNYCTNEIASEGDAGIFYKTQDYNLTLNEIGDFLTEMKNGTAKYLQGGHSLQCTGDLKISYKINGNFNYVKINMIEAQVLSSTDGNIFKIIDSNVTDEISEHCLYSAGTASQTIKNIIEKLNYQM